jgi:hypothetical protein
MRPLAWLLAAKLPNLKWCIGTGAAKKMAETSGAVLA